MSKQKAHQKLNQLTAVLMMAAVAALAAPAVQAGAGPSGPGYTYEVPGQLGAVAVNPYKIAPLTAVIYNGGYVLKNVSVRIVPKQNGQEIAYKVGDNQAKTYGGIPVFGLYADWRNTVEVEYDRWQGDQMKHIKETYRIWTAPAYVETDGYGARDTGFFNPEVKKVDPEFKDRLYFVNNLGQLDARSTKTVWNNPVGGALQWNYSPQNTIIDTTGEIRWYMLPETIYSFDNIWYGGTMMGFRQEADGAMSWGYGQRYAKYDIMGREIFNRRLPTGYADFSHASKKIESNGHYLLRVASDGYKRPDNKIVRTVRDVILEVDGDGNVVDDFRLFEILDPYRDNVLKAIDQGAVCLNIDPAKQGKTLTAEELAKQDQNDHFGDIVGSGAGRNWAHINSVDYDETDDSIIISSRHQSAIIKIGRDKKVKWILGSHEGWKTPYQDKLLQPVDKNGKPIKCEGSKCEGDFDWTWTQHTGWKVRSELSKGDVIYISAFDNGDARGMEQPALPEMKYSRAVVYKVDQKKMTVEQVWEYGKERGHAWYSPVTSLTEYYGDKDSIMVYSATAGAEFDWKTFSYTKFPSPVIDEFKWLAKEPSVEIILHGAEGYQAFPFDVKKAFHP
ncbi:aryl-sulfate sulfotransferase [Sutterella wadsworthensis]|jgi:arylsulfotransferase|uniref:aryl-sulfate sulfotransferase n=1 Tax=Sutterella wadsworthensis TaxID=40545 RepID=UPI003966A535